MGVRRPHQRGFCCRQGMLVKAIYEKKEKRLSSGVTRPKGTLLRILCCISEIQSGILKRLYSTRAKAETPIFGLLGCFLREIRVLSCVRAKDLHFRYVSP